MPPQPTVRENECAERRKDIYGDLKAHTESIAKVKGGIVVLQVILPTLLAVMALWLNAKFDAINDKLHYMQDRQIRDLNKVLPSTSEVEEVRGVFQPVILQPESMEEASPE